MKVNVKALYALASYYAVFPCKETNGWNSTTYFHRDERHKLWLDFQMHISEIALKESKYVIMHLGLFFKPSRLDSVYITHITCNDVAKFLRYVAKNAKFPPHYSLKWCWDGK